MGNGEESVLGMLQGSNMTSSDNIMSCKQLEMFSLWRATNGVPLSPECVGFVCTNNFASLLCRSPLETKRSKTQYAAREMESSHGQIKLFCLKTFAELGH